MKNYTRPTLIRNEYIVANKTICKDVSDIITTEGIDWKVGGVENGTKNGLK